jgi:hypothetical protein
MNKNRQMHASSALTKMNKSFLSKMRFRNYNSVLKEIWVIYNEIFKHKSKIINANSNTMNLQEVSDSVHYKTNTSEADKQLDN